MCKGYKKIFQAFLRANMRCKNRSILSKGCPGITYKNGGGDQSFQYKWKVVQSITDNINLVLFRALFLGLVEGTATSDFARAVLEMDESA